MKAGVAHVEDHVGSELVLRKVREQASDEFGRQKIVDDDVWERLGETIVGRKRFTDGARAGRIEAKTVGSLNGQNWIL